MTRRAGRTPTYALYGEFLEQSRRDVLHYEPLRARSARHDWTIELHRHATLWQFFHLAQAGMELRMGDTALLTETPVLMLAPPLLEHGFRFPPDAPGGVVSVRLPVMDALLDGVAGAQALAAQGWIMRADDAEYAHGVRAFDDIASGFQRIDELRNKGLRASVDALLVAFLRHALAAGDAAWPDSAAVGEDALLRRFCQLVEAQFASNWPLPRYAAALDVSPATLTRHCRAVLGVTPLRLVTRRRVLEAERLLQLTRLPVADIGSLVGFDEPSYFTRFFRRETSRTPAAYRREHAG